MTDIKLVIITIILCKTQLYNNKFKCLKKHFRSIKIRRRRVKKNCYTVSSAGFYAHYCLYFLISIQTIINRLMVSVRRMIKTLYKNQSKGK